MTGDAENHANGPQRQTNRQDETVLQQVAAKLVEIAERLEGDARD